MHGKEVGSKSGNCLDNAHVNEGEEYQLHANKFVLLRVARAASHEGKLSLFVGQRDSRNEISSNIDTKHQHCAKWQGQTQDNETEERQHLKNKLIHDITIVLR